MDVEDGGDGLVGDRCERHNLRQTGQELWAEVALHDVHQFVVLGHLAVVELSHDILGTDVRGKQDECVGEVAHTPQTVVQLTLVEYLQEQVEDTLVSLLYLVEEHDRVGVLANLVDQQTAFLVAYISWRRTVEQGHRVLLLELRHVEAQQGALVAK